MSRLTEAERLVRRLRQRIFDYYEESEAKGLKAQRVLAKAITRMAKLRGKSEYYTKTDEFGATAHDRAILARHGMAWGD